MWKGGTQDLWQRHGKLLGRLQQETLITAYIKKQNTKDRPTGLIPQCHHEKKTGCQLNGSDTPLLHGWPDFFIYKVRELKWWFQIPSGFNLMKFYSQWILGAPNPYSCFQVKSYLILNFTKHLYSIIFLAETFLALFSQFLRIASQADIITSLQSSFPFSPPDN